MSRTRLTARNRASAGQEAYPGNVNQPDRTDPEMDQYHTFEQKVNHELPDMRHDWQTDEHDEIGFGVTEPWGKSPTVASVRVAANKAVRIAVLLLGEKVEDEVIEKQANDFMAMGHQAMDNTLARFADTQTLYASEDDEDDEEKTASDDEEKVEAKASDDEEKKEEKVEAKASDDEEKVEAKASDDEEDKVEEKTSSAKVSANELDIELTGGMDDEIDDDPEADKRLASCFEDHFVAENSTKKVEASQKKAGISKLGGQPRVISAGRTDEGMSGLWKSAPDVQDVFK